MALLAWPRYLLEYGAVRILLFLVQVLPLRAALCLGECLGECLGRLGALVGRRAVRIAMDNLCHAYPEMSPKEARAMVVRVCKHFGRAVVESVLARRRLNPSSLARHVVVRNEHVLGDVMSEGKGAIFVTAHLGVWEILGQLVGCRGGSLHSIYRPIKNPLIDRLVRKWRSVGGQRMVPRRGALRKLLRVLRERGYIGLLMDQHAKSDGVWVPFFGRPASTTPTPALLALRTGAPIVTGYARRLPGVYRFEIFWDEPIHVIPTDDRAADIERITRQLSQRMEGYIREFPEQWLWLHRRWHNPPAEVLERGVKNVRSPGEAG